MYKKYNHFPDNKLVILLRDDFFDNHTVFECIYRKHVDELFKYVRTKWESQQECLDIIQEVYSDFWENRNSLSQMTSTKITSIFQYLINAVNIRIVRCMSHQPQKYEEHYNFFERIYELQRQTNTKADFKTTLLNGMQLIPLQYQEIVLLRLQGRNNLEVANDMGISERRCENYIILTLAHLVSIQSSCWPIRPN